MTNESPTFFIHTDEGDEEVPSDITHLTTRPSMRSIRRWAFQSYKHLVEVRLLEGLVEIEGGAFQFCVGLKSISFPSTLERIEQDAFHFCISLVDIDLPNNRLKTIGERAFMHCEGLQSISVPETVETIGCLAFGWCHSLTTVNLHEGLLRTCRTFQECENLTSMHFPSTVAECGDSTLDGCSSLVAVTLPPRMTFIDRHLFQDCKVLQNNVAIPKTVRSISDRAFYGCASLLDVQLPDVLNFIRYKSFANCTALCTIALPSTLWMVQREAFSNCTSLLSVEVPTGFKASIGPRTFDGCTALVNISIPCTVNEMADNAFSRCDLLQYDTNCGVLERFTQLPIHKACYNSSLTTLDDLLRVLDSSRGGHDLEDAYGMTPLHLVATAATPKTEILECLLETYPLKILEHQDRYGKTMMDYLLKRPSRIIVPLVRIVLQKAVIDKIATWGRNKWILDISHRVKSIDCGDNTTRRRRCVDEVIGLAGYYARIEMTSLMELALWKRQLVAKASDNVVNDGTHRSSCQFHCGAEVVVENVIGFLWDTKNKVRSGLMIFPLYTDTINETQE